ncbi:MAG: PH domain-containing protein, partial [Lachnospiraceae bacterium]|nr:PH domain-containing protein [Lachnospiraceae bacterium]
MWRARKRLWCGLPWTFTVYSFDEERLFVDSGILNKRQDEVRLYRVQDLTVTRSLIQRIFGLGTIHLSTKDQTMGNFDLINLRDVMDVKEDLSRKVEAQRDKKRVSVREFIGDDDT